MNEGGREGGRKRGREGGEGGGIWNCWASPWRDVIARRVTKLRSITSEFSNVELINYVISRQNFIK